MRTTLSLDEDVLERALAVAGRLRMPLQTVINEALRLGLSRMEKPVRRRPYKMVPHEMGLRAGCNLDSIQGLLAQADGESSR